MGTMMNSLKEWRLTRHLSSTRNMNPMTLLLGREQEGFQVILGRLEGRGRLKIAQRGLVSKEHCQISYRDCAWHVLDLGAKNNTFLNCEEIHEERQLQHGDMLGLGIDSLDSNLVRERYPFESYFIFRFEQVELGIPPQSSTIINSRSVSASVKREVPEVITLDSDDDGDEPMIVDVMIKSALSKLNDGALSRNSNSIGAPYMVTEPAEPRNNDAEATQRTHDLDVEARRSAGGVKKEEGQEDYERGLQEKQRREVEVNQKRELEEAQHRKMTVKRLQKEDEVECQRQLEEKQHTEEEVKQLGEADTFSVEITPSFSSTSSQSKHSRELDPGLQGKESTNFLEDAEGCETVPSNSECNPRVDNPGSRDDEEEAKRLGEEARIAEAQLMELQSVSTISSRRSSMDMEAVSETDMQQVRKRYVELNERFQKKLHPKESDSAIAQTSESTATRKYRRIKIPSESEDEYVDHSPNPHVPMEPRNTAMSSQILRLAQNVQQHPAKVKLPPAAISLTERNVIQVSRQLHILNQETVAKIVAQFQASCAENGKLVRTASNQVELLPKPAEDAKRKISEVQIEEKASPLKKHRAESEQNSIYKTPELNPGVPPSSNNHTSGVGEQQPSPFNSATPSLPEHIATTVPGTGAHCSPNGTNKRNPQQPPKTLREITKSISKHHRRPEPVPLTVPHTVPPRRCNGGNSLGTPTKVLATPSSSLSAAFQKEQEEARKSKLHQLTVKEKETAPPVAKRKPNAPIFNKVTKVSRGEQLCNALLEVVPPPSKTSQPARSKPKAEIAPNSLKINLSEADNTNKVSFVEKIISNIENNNLFDVIERPASKITSIHGSTKDTAKVHTGNTIGVHSASATITKPSTSTDCGAPRVQHHESQSVWCRTGLPNTSRATTASVPKPSTYGSSQATVVAPNDRLPEDQVYRDALRWNPQWLQEHGSNATAPPVVLERPLLTNLPIYKNYKSYKDTFYPLMLLELWASISQEYKTAEGGVQHKRNQGHEQSATSFDLPVGIENVRSTNVCPFLVNPNQQSSQEVRVQKSDIAKSKTKGKQEDPFYHCIGLIALVDKNGAVTRQYDFGTVTFDFKRASGEIQQFSFFAFFQEPKLEEISGTTFLPNCLEAHRYSQRYKMTVTAVTHFKCDMKKLVLTNVGKISKICYVSPKIRDFRVLSQLPDTSLFEHILSPPKFSSDDVMKSEAVPRSELVASVHESLNPVQRSVVHQICRRVVNVQGCDMMLLHGPAGTGKTRTVVGLLMQLTMDYRQKNPGKQPKILVCTPSNTAVDEIIRRLTKHTEGLNIVRIGTGSVSNDTKKFMLEEMAKPRFSKTGQIDSINESIAGVDRKIEQANKELSNLKSPTEKKNSAVAASLEANIEEWGRDRQLYVCDLKTLGHLARTMFEDAVNDRLELELEPFFGMPSGVEVEELLRTAHFTAIFKRMFTEPSTLISTRASRKSIEVGCDVHSNIDQTLPKTPKLELAISLDTTCSEVLTALENRQVTLETVRLLLSEFSELSDPCKDLVDLVAEADVQSFTYQWVDDVSQRLLPKPFLKFLQPVETSADGNCFYRAISSIIFGVQSFHALLRVRILLDILENHVSYHHFTLRAMTEDDYEKLVDGVARDGAYAGDAVLYATSRILRRPINVYTDFHGAPSDDTAFLLYMSASKSHRRTLFSNTDDQKQPACIHYRSSFFGGSKDHFVALLPKCASPLPCNMDEYTNLRNFGL